MHPSAVHNCWLVARQRKQQKSQNWLQWNNNLVFITTISPLKINKLTFNLYDRKGSCRSVCSGIQSDLHIVCLSWLYSIQCHIGPVHCYWRLVSTYIVSDQVVHQWMATLWVLWWCKHHAIMYRFMGKLFPSAMSTTPSIAQIFRMLLPVEMSDTP